MLPTPLSEPAVRVQMPICPSTNSLYANLPGKGRIKTAAYKRWQNDAGWAIRLQRPPTVHGRIAVLIELPSDRLDVDNIKPILDLLGPPSGKKKTGMFVIDDDRYVDDLRIVRIPPGAEMMTVSIWPMP